MTEQNPAIVRYAEYSAEEFEKDVDRANQIGGSSLMDLKQGENVVRFVPSATPGKTPMRSTGMHYVDAIPGLDRVVVFACPKKELGQPCPVCDMGSQMQRSANPIDRERGERIASKLTLYANVIDRSAPADDPNYGLRVLRFGKQILEQLKTIRRSTRTGGDFFDPGPNGFDIVITREGEMKSTKYKVIPDRNNSPMFQEVELVQAVIDNAYDLDSFVTPVVPEEVLRVLEANAGQARSAAAQPRALPARAASPALPATARSATAPRVGSTMFTQPAAAPAAPSAAKTIADADFTDEDDDAIFGPPPEPKG